MKTIRLLAVLTAAFSMLLGSAVAEEASQTQTVARVNGVAIPRSELNGAMQGILTQMMQAGRSVPADQKDVFEQRVLNDIVNRELLLQQGRAAGQTNVGARVAEELAAVIKEAGGEDGFANALKESNITRAKYEDRIRENAIVSIVIQGAVTNAINVSTNDISKVYDQHRAEFRQPALVRASHILLLCPSQASADDKALKRAQIDAIRVRLQQGEKLADLAKQFSEDPGSATNGGDLGYFPRGRMVPEFETAAFTLKTNELSEVITTPYGFHLLLVTDQKPERQLELSEVSDIIANKLKQDRGSEALRNYINKLRETARIENLLAPPVTIPVTPAPPTSTPTPEPVPVDPAPPAVTTPKLPRP